MSQSTIVTVGDTVRLTKDLMGTVRFIGEIAGRKGIYYGIELTEKKGKSNGSVNNVSYFKCKNKRGLFLRHARIQEVVANDSIHRLGINDEVSLSTYAGNRKCIGKIRYIGIPHPRKEVYYGIEFKKPIGDTDGLYSGTRYFESNKNCAAFLKASTKGIFRNGNTQSNGNNDTTSSSAMSNGNGHSAREIELDIFSDAECNNNNNISVAQQQQPIFSIAVQSSFTFSELMTEISKMSQYISSVFDVRFESGNNNNNKIPAHNWSSPKKESLPLSEEILTNLRDHSPHFYKHGKFYVIEPLRKGIAFEENDSYQQALKVYESLVKRNGGKSTEALSYYANCLVMLDKFDLAEASYEKAFSINPFCGDICYFYSRLLEYRSKYDDAKNLFNRVMSYVKKYKSALPPPHHPVHFGCYARLGRKYVKLSMDKYNRSKQDVQDKLNKCIQEKEERQFRIDELERLLNSADKNEKKELVISMNKLNNSISKLEAKLLKKEAIIRDKDREIESKRNEIFKLTSQLNGKTESQSKIVAQTIISKEKLEKVSTESHKSSKNGISNKKEQKTRPIPNESKLLDTTGIYKEYQPFFVKLETKKEQSEARKKKLLNGLLCAEKMKCLADCVANEDRQTLMKDKLELCAVVCDFHSTHHDHLSRIENKKDLLLEVLQCMSSNKWSSITLLEQCIETIWVNLFRSLPDASMIKTDASDDEMDFRDPGWDHLQLIYELTFHVVTNTHIDKKTMKKHLQGQFLEHLIHLFSSADDREPQYVKIIVHAIYGRFMALRKSVRKHLSDYCYKYVYRSCFRDTTSWQGLPEILEIFCSIFQGLNVPVKPDYHLVLRNVIVPLHKSFHLDEFHEQLLQCCTQFVTKDPHSAPVILGGMLKFWPKFSPLKEQLFITEIVHILNVCVRHPNIKHADPAFATITIAVLKQFVQCMVSPHHQVAERSLMVWRDETVRICVDLHREKIWPHIYKALQSNKEKYWLSAIRNINRQIMSDFKRRDPEFFEKIEKQQQSHDINAVDPLQRKTQLENREQRWLKLRELAQKK